MSSMAVSCIVFACIFGGALLGMLLQPILPQSHLSSDSKDTVKLGAGLIGTMAALVLGLLVASAKSSYDTQVGEVTDLSAKVKWLDRVLSHYGPEARHVRELLRRGVDEAVAQIWSGEHPQGVQTMSASSTGEALYDAIHQLSPTTDTQRAIQSEALSACTNLGQTRSLLARQQHSSISLPFLIVVVFWLTIMFLSFGLFAPRNATVIATLVTCAVSVAGAIFLVLELDRPFHGLIQIPSDLLKSTLAQLGR